MNDEIAVTGEPIDLTPFSTVEEAIRARTRDDVIKFLWGLLDDIDTHDDAAKCDDVGYRKAVRRTHNRRWETGITTDGYTLNMTRMRAPTVARKLGQDVAREMDDADGEVGMDEIDRELDEIEEEVEARREAFVASARESVRRTLALTRESVLPQVLDDGTVTLCDSISGGADEVSGMPRSLSLVRRLPDGTERRARYHVMATSSAGPIAMPVPSPERRPITYQVLGATGIDALWHWLFGDKWLAKRAGKALLATTYKGLDLKTTTLIVATPSGHYEVLDVSGKVRPCRADPGMPVLP